MRYLRLRRSQILLSAFVLSSILLIAFADIDIDISRVFFDGRSFPHDLPWQKFLQVGISYFVAASVLGMVAIYAFNLAFKRNICGVDGHRVLFVVLVLAIGCGAIVNVGLKNEFGRARPRDIVEFGGRSQFTPAFYISNQCHKNCSFSSGDAAAGFFSLSLALALSRRRAWFAAALMLGALVSVGRISSGAHYFSDALVSFFIMFILTDALFFYLVSNRGLPRLDEGANEAVLPMDVTVPESVSDPA